MTDLDIIVGRASIFKFKNSQWSYVANLTGGSGDVQFAEAVDMFASTNANHLAVGGAGFTYIYESNATLSWKEVVKFTSTSTSFGSAVAISNATCVVGSNMEGKVLQAKMTLNLCMSLDFLFVR